MKNPENQQQQQQQHPERGTNTEFMPESGKFMLRMKTDETGNDDDNDVRLWRRMRLG